MLFSGWVFLGFVISVWLLGFLFVCVVVVFGAA